MNPLYVPVADRAHHRCEYCHAPEAVVNFPMEVEHIVPESAGGTDETSNLALACRSCNAFKAFRQFGDDPETQETVPLFHPRRDAWAEHFGLDEESNAIRGLTPTGRVTVLLLRMNSPAQLLARREWRRLDLFP